MSLTEAGAFAAEYAASAPAGKELNNEKQQEGGKGPGGGAGAPPLSPAPSRLRALAEKNKAKSYASPSSVDASPSSVASGVSLSAIYDVLAGASSSNNADSSTPVVEEGGSGDGGDSSGGLLDTLSSAFDSINEGGEQSGEQGGEQGEEQEGEQEGDSFFVHLNRRVTGVVLDLADLTAGREGAEQERSEQKELERKITPALASLADQGAEIDIQGCETVSDGTGNYTVFVMHVKGTRVMDAGGSEVGNNGCTAGQITKKTIKKRYRDFSTLHEQLCSMQHVSLPFPRKLMMWATDEDLDERRVMLGVFMQRALQEMVDAPAQEEMRKFLATTDAGEAQEVQQQQEEQGGGVEEGVTPTATSAVEGILSSFGFVEEIHTQGGEGGHEEEGQEQGHEQEGQEQEQFFAGLFGLGGEQAEEQGQHQQQEEEQESAEEGGGFFTELNRRVSDAMQAQPVATEDHVEGSSTVSSSSMGQEGGAQEGERVVSDAQAKLEARVAKFKAKKAQLEAEGRA
jgi:hypothetical protein